MKLKTILMTGLIVLVTSPAHAALSPAPGPEAGGGIGAMALLVGGYLALRRRFGR